MTDLDRTNMSFMAGLAFNAIKDFIINDEAVYIEVAIKRTTDLLTALIRARQIMQRAESKASHPSHCQPRKENDHA